MSSKAGPFQLWDMDQHTLELEHTHHEQGGVFEFVLFNLEHLLEPCPKVDVALHQAALDLLFQKTDQRNLEQQREWAKRHPIKQVHATPAASIYYDLDVARPQQLTESEIVDLVNVKGWRQGESPLCLAFCDPPYSMRGEDKEKEARFPKWVKHLGLECDAGVVAFDWVGDPNVNPKQSEWSDYFDDGKEWWGIWCLTVYNPRRNTLAALMASATD